MKPQLIRPWSYRIASRCDFKWLKRNRRFVQPDDNTFAGGEIASPDRGDLQLFVTAGEFLEFLSPASRAVLVLHYLHEHTLPEVAAILEISPGTVRSRLFCLLGLTFGMWFAMMFAKDDHKGLPFGLAAVISAVFVAGMNGRKSVV